MKLLFVEDEMGMAQALCQILKLEKYEVTHCKDGVTGADELCSGIYDIAILDVMLPGKNGFAIVEEARKNGIQTPVLMLTAKAELEDRVNGLDCGADDYLTKPFMTKELLARLRALLRRNHHISDGRIHFGDIALDTNTCTLYCSTNQQNIRLSEKEYHILEYMITNAGQILTREQLAVRIWGYDSEAEYNNVEVYMSFTRKKLAFVNAQTKIKAVRGMGYELRCEEHV